MDLVYFDDARTSLSAATTQPDFELTEEEKNLLCPPAASSDERYCLCQRTEAESAGERMIQCDVCLDWLHEHCVGLTAEEMLSISHYECPSCSPVPQKRPRPAESDLDIVVAALDLIHKQTAAMLQGQQPRPLCAASLPPVSFKSCASRGAGFESSARKSSLWKVLI